MSLAGPAAVALADQLGEIVELGASMAPLCTYKVGGGVAALVEARSIADLEAVRDVVASNQVPILVVGKGSNLLVSDAGFDGIAIRLGDRFSEVVIDAAQSTVTAGGAALMPVVARKTAAAGLVGFEWAVGVPGSIGGGVKMNAGGHGSDVAASLVQVSVLDLHGDLDGDGPITMQASDLDLQYRHSNLSQASLVLSAQFVLTPGDPETANEQISEIVRWRREHQPGGQNAGSVFRNPPDDSAGRLIDLAGLKGFRIGTAEISAKHANFIQADPDGCADDVRSLIQHIQAVVLDASGVSLVPENRMIGF